MMRKKGESDAGSTEATSPAETTATETTQTAQPDTAAETQDAKKPESVTDALKRNADLQDVVNTFQGGEVSQKNWIAIVKRILSDYVHSVPLSLVQLMETIINRIEGGKDGEQSASQPNGGGTPAAGATSATGEGKGPA